MHLKLKSIGAIVNKQKKLYVYHGPTGTQWIGTGDVMYPIYNLPHMEVHQFADVLDVPSDTKKRNGYFMKELDPGTLDYIDEDCSAATPVKGNRWVRRSGSTDYIPLLSSKGLMFIDSVYLTPLERLDFCKLNEAYNVKMNQYYIIVQDGFDIAAMIQPSTHVSAKMLQEELKDMILFHHLGIYARHADWLRRNSPDDEPEEEPPEEMDYAGNLLDEEKAQPPETPTEEVNQQNDPDEQ